MKIAIPSRDARLAEYFAHCEEVAVVEIDKASKAFQIPPWCDLLATAMVCDPTSFANKA